MERHEIKHSINRYLDNLYEADEIDQLQAIIRSEIDSGYLDERIKELWIECLDESYVEEYDKRELKKEARLLIERIEQFRPRKKRTLMKKWISIAAALLILFATSLTYYIIRDQNPAEEEITYLELEVPYGERKELLLADGSRVILNAGTLIRYPEKFPDHERNIFLDGEAFFAVQSDRNQPFIVSTANMTIKVLGTEFNVKTYGEDELASVAVQKGKVRVETEDMSSQLIAGDHITLNNRTKDYQKKKVDAANITYWVKGGLAFYNAPITDVVKELTRIYNCKIHFEEGQTFMNLIEGEHDNKSIESVLKSIEYTSGIKFRKEGKDYILYKE